MKPCIHCGKPFEPQYTAMQIACTLRCARSYAVKQRQDKDRAEKVRTRERKQAAKRLPDLIAEAQTSFNAYIRARDADLPCICCGKPFEPNKPGGSMDAGHYLARSIAPQHRFTEDNVFGQRKNCNRPGGTTRAKFRAGVIERIGLERVEAVEAETAVKKWTREELIAIRDTYRAKTKELKKETA
jgi:hypothetical protein